MAYKGAFVQHIKMTKLLHWKSRKILHFCLWPICPFICLFVAYMPVYLFVYGLFARLFVCLWHMGTLL